MENKDCAPTRQFLLDLHYRATLLNTVSLAAATAIVTLMIATISGLFLQRHRFPGHALLVAMLTFPLAFPGVMNFGFMIILLAGRHGLVGDLSMRLFGSKQSVRLFAARLFLGYLYFSIPRVILTVMALVEKLRSPALKRLPALSAPAPGASCATSSSRRWRQPSSHPGQSLLPPQWARSAPPLRSRPMSTFCRC